MDWKDLKNQIWKKEDHSRVTVKYFRNIKDWHFVDISADPWISLMAGKHRQIYPFYFCLFDGSTQFWVV